MKNATVIYTRKNHIAHVTLNRPGTKNLINEELALGLEDVCRRINEDDDVYVAILAGAGAAFCIGGESEVTTSGCSPAGAIAGIDRPVIAAINGDALGQGLELALGCDIRLASKGARFGLPQVAMGLIPMDGGTQRLPRIVGKSKAMELLFTSQIITSHEAFAIGLVSRVVHDKELMAEAEALAETIAAKGPIAIKFIKEAVNKGLDMTLEQGLRLEADLYFLLQTTADRTEGIRAFLEKRPPRFKGE